MPFLIFYFLFFIIAVTLQDIDYKHENELINNDQNPTFSFKFD